MHPLCTHSLVLLADQINGWEQDVATTLLDFFTLFKVVFRQWCIVCVNCTSCSKFSTFFTASSGFMWIVSQVWCSFLSTKEYHSLLRQLKQRDSATQFQKPTLTHWKLSLSKVLQVAHQNCWSIFKKESMDWSGFCLLYHMESGLLRLYQY